MCVGEREVRIPACSTAQRLKLLRNTCTNVNVPYNDTIFNDARNFARFFVQETEKVIYCGIQSTGSKTWRARIDDALGLKDGETANPQLVAQNKKLKEKGIAYLSEFTTKEIGEMLSGSRYRKVLVLKHPLTRFMSAYDTRAKNGPHWTDSGRIQHQSRAVRTVRDH